MVVEQQSAGDVKNLNCIADIWLPAILFGNLQTQQINQDPFSSSMPHFLHTLLLW